MSTIAGDLAETIVRAVIAARTTLGWSQRRLAKSVGVSQTLVSRFERREPAAVSIEAAERMFDALGIRAQLQADLPVIHGERLQVDLVHAWACGYVGRRLTALGWEVRHEAEVGHGRYRGWIDVLGYRPKDRSLLVNECKTDLLDIGAIQRATSWYEREAWTAARRFGWRPVRTVVFLLLLDSAEVEARLRTNRPLLETSFPGRSAQIGRWIEQPGPAPPSRCLAMIDPAGRGQRWLRPSRIDGRRTRSRYENYADAAGRLTTRAS
jgi:transcriptional regulator with XRE-family HTH domain